MGENALQSATATLQTEKFETDWLQVFQDAKHRKKN
jgi:hypothetical protein